jgi:hypothetical protein
MLDSKQHRRVTRCCADALAKAIQSLPGYLDRCPADRAAAIVAGLIQGCVAPQLKQHPEDRLQAIFRRIAEEPDQEDRGDKT